MSKFSLLQNDQPVFKPSSAGSGGASWLLVVGFLVLLGVLDFMVKSMGRMVEVANTPRPNPGLSPDDLRRLTAELKSTNESKP